MFSPSHLIYQFAEYHDEVDDYLPYAEGLIEHWSNSDTPVKFQDAFEIKIACLLLHDGLLPQAAVFGLSHAFIEAMTEASDKRLRIEALRISPPPAGRKRDNSQTHYFWAVRDLLKQGVTKSEAYSIVAERHSKSVDTIRRVVERAEKSIRDKKAKRSSP